MKSLIIIKVEENRTMAIKETNGLMKAITYAKGMSAEEVQRSLVLNPPLPKEWRDFDTTTGTYC